MKRLLSISFAFLILLSGMHLTVATHFCGGKIAFTKLSVSGELASCGMEGKTDKCTLPVKFKTHNCCKDKVSAFVVDNNYAPTFSEFKVFPQPVLHAFILPLFLSDFSQATLTHICTNVSPPGHFLVSDVSLPGICVFRI